jgi:hypothetical protein
MADSSFQVIVPSGFSNPDPRSLSDEERAMAPGIAGSVEEFRRNRAEYLADVVGRKRQRGRELGEQVQSVLADIGSGYRLVSVTWNGNTLSWKLEIGTPQGAHNVVLPWTFVDDVLDSRTATEIQRLRNMVLFGLGRRDLIFEGRK